MCASSFEGTGDADGGGGVRGAGAEGPAPAPPLLAGEANPLDLAVSVTRQVEISGPSSWEHLICGIDSLDLGFYVDWRLNWLVLEKALAAGKQAAEKTSGIAWDYAKADGCLILPSGKPPMYAFHLQTADFHLFIARRQKADKYPIVFVSLLARSLWLRGIKAAVENVEAFITKLGGHVDRIQVSRVDLAADFVIPGGLTLEFLLGCRVSQSSKHSHHVDGTTLETFYVGSTTVPILCRIYDKSKEILKDGLKDWFFTDVWKREHCGDVWRVEFQLRRDALKEFNIDSPESLLDRASGMWAYLTDNWMSFRLNDNENVSRRTVHLWWQAVQEVEQDFGGTLDVKREYAKGGQAGAEWYVAHAAGCLVGFAARIHVDDFDSALGVIAAEVRQYWRQHDFEERVRVERIKLGFDDTQEKGAA